MRKVRLFRTVNCLRTPQKLEPPLLDRRLFHLLHSSFQEQVDALGRPMLSQTPTPVFRKPAVDASGMPLPRRVDQIDQNATRVIPVQHEVTPVSRQGYTPQKPAATRVNGPLPVQTPRRVVTPSGIKNTPEE